MDDMFCPLCSGIVTLHDGAVVAFGPRRNLSLKFDRYVACTSCPMVSEVGHGGVLMDLGMLTLDDLEQPYVKPDAPPLLCQRPAGLLKWRRDS